MDDFSGDDELGVLSEEHGSGMNHDAVHSDAPIIEASVLDADEGHQAPGAGFEEVFGSASFNDGDSVSGR
jgi:hypothetical protein